MPTTRAERLREALREELDRLLVDAHGVPEAERDEWATRLARVARHRLAADPAPAGASGDVDAAWADHTPSFWWHQAVEYVRFRVAEEPTLLWPGEIDGILEDADARVPADRP